jgi:hypothetical protein
MLNASKTKNPSQHRTYKRYEYVTAIKGTILLHIIMVFQVNNNLIFFIMHTEVIFVHAIIIGHVIRCDEMRRGVVVESESDGAEKIVCKVKREKMRLRPWARIPCSRHFPFLRTF